MARERTTLSGEDAEQFADIREDLSEHRRGELSNAEVVRRLMEMWEKEQSPGRR
ncbi:hypothetical protein ACFQFH_20070 [Halobaculum halobium]|uniref:Ribbon-helix-helix protein, copG family n=1 Tax=Halobaculum halobium TaxID=3032281 RepID=A0ABD5TF71_9EURY|nr:hypothetical protein [Halobaculum sp. SYNS20]